MKKLLLVLALLLAPLPAAAQCNGVFGPNTLCGNLTGSPAPPKQFSASGTVVGPVTSTLNGLPFWANTLGTLLADANGNTIAGVYAWSGAQTFNVAATFKQASTLAGATSGAVTFGPPAIAGTTTFTLPGSNGTNGFFLKTDGAGATSWIAGGTVTSFVCGNTTITTTGNCYVPGQVVGTATNDNATAGNFGEYTSASVVAGSAVSLSSNVVSNVTSISLTAGDWDVYGVVLFVPAATTNYTSAFASLSTTTGVEDQSLDRITIVRQPAGSVPANNITETVGPARFSVASTTVVFMTARSAFTVSTMGGAGIIRARRVR